VPWFLRVEIYFREVMKQGKKIRITAIVMDIIIK